MTGCETTSPTPHLEEQAGATLGLAQAPIAVPRQPEECRYAWPLLPRSALVGHEALDGIAAYEAYVTHTINPSKLRCYQFNETVRRGFAGETMKGKPS